MASLIPGLRRVAPRLSKDFFICHQCLKHSRPRLQLPVKANPSRNIRFNSSTTALPQHAPASPLNSLSKTISSAERQKIAAEGHAKAKGKKGFFPDTSSNTVAYWLLASAGSVFGIVVFGGLTRLTESGYFLPEFQSRFQSPTPKRKNANKWRVVDSVSQNGNP